jgi:hypothetical protein
MKGILTFFALFFLCNLSAQVNNIYANAGIAVTVGAPTYKPGAKGSIVAIDSVTGTWYVSRDRYAANGNWLSMGQRIEQISGCSAPAYTPNKYNSDLVINNCAVPELYYHSGGGVWVQLNASGSTYTAGTGIAISGSNVISNTAPDQTVSLTGAGGNVITGTYPSFTITGTPATGAETIVTAGTGASVTGAGTSGSPYVVSSTITQYTDELAQDAVGAMVGNTLTYTDATPLLDVKTQMSITSDASGVKLSGDAASPGNSKLYGTDGSGVKGWQSQPTGTTDLSISGSSSPLTINSSTGTDITATAGTGISLAGTSGNMTITNSSPSLWTDGGATTYLTATTDNVAIGGTSASEQLEITKNFRLPATTASTVGVIMSGANRFLHSYAAATADGKNLFVGVEAGNFTMSPSGGASSLASYNIGIGYRSLYANTTGYYNVGIGVNTLIANTTGNKNNAFGYLAMSANTTGANNQGIGYTALSSNTTGSGNVGVGSGTLSSNTTASNNTAIGTSALVSNIDNPGNTAIGTRALNVLGSSSGDGYNTATGYESMLRATTGAENSGFGTQSLYAVTTGNKNIGIGVAAGVNITTGSKNIVIGYNNNAASATASNQLNIGNCIYGTGLSGTGSTIAGSIGIGTAAPSEVLSVAGNVQLTTAGNKLKIATGTNASIGTSTLAAGTVTVSTTAVATGSHIVVCYDTPAGTLASGLSAPTASIVNGTSFVINSLTTAGVVNTLDTSTVRWFIIN